jgi:ribosomal protein L37E
MTKHSRMYIELDTQDEEYPRVEPEYDADGRALPVYLHTEAFGPRTPVCPHCGHPNPARTKLDKQWRIVGEEVPTHCTKCGFALALNSAE